MKIRYTADYLPEGLETDPNNFETVIAKSLADVMALGRSMNSVSHDECYNIRMQVYSDEQWRSEEYYDNEGGIL